MAYVECVTKKELETALKNGDVPVLRSGVWEIVGSATVTHVVIRQGKKPTVRI